MKGESIPSFNMECSGGIKCPPVISTRRAHFNYRALLCASLPDLDSDIRSNCNKNYKHFRRRRSSASPPRTQTVRIETLGNKYQDTYSRHRRSSHSPVPLVVGRRRRGRLRSVDCRVEALRCSRLFHGPVCPSDWGLSSSNTVPRRVSQSRLKWPLACLRAENCRQPSSALRSRSG